MYGAIIGDVAGSYYEFLEAKAKKNKILRSYEEKTQIMNKETPLFTNDSSVTDDTILTTAIADAIINNRDYEESLKDYGIYEISHGNDKYGRSRFEPDFLKWLLNTGEGICYENGSAMRISPVGFLFDNLKDVKIESYKATSPSHNNIESYKAAEAVATSIFLLRKGLSKEELREYIQNNYYKLDYSLEELRLNYVFTSKASSSVPQALFCFLKSNDFEDTIRTSISIGGDSDTIACIAGSLAEAYYGVPKNLIEEVEKYLPVQVRIMLDRFYALENNKVYIKNRLND